MTNTDGESDLILEGKRSVDGIPENETYNFENEGVDLVRLEKSLKISMCKISESNRESSRRNNDSNGNNSSKRVARRSLHFDGGPNQDI